MYILICRGLHVWTYFSQDVNSMLAYCLFWSSSPWSHRLYNIAHWRMLSRPWMRDSWWWQKIKTYPPSPPKERGMIQNIALVAGRPGFARRHIGRISCNTRLNLHIPQHVPPNSGKLNNPRIQNCGNSRNGKQRFLNFPQNWKLSCFKFPRNYFFVLLRVV